MKDSYTILGVMSGTSLDGLDLAVVRFDKCEDKTWRFQLLHSETCSYTPILEKKLRTAIQMSDRALQRLDLELGKFIGEQILKCAWVSTDSIDFIASHGHTVFHQPEKGITLQIGSAEQIFKYCSIPVINNFREADVKAGGQGAPLVPIGDRDLFSEYDFALNLGGIANISFQTDKGRLAFDVCPFNMALNEIASRADLPYDENGQMAASGKIIPELLEELNQIRYYEKSYPKSLGLEDYEELWQSIIQDKDHSLPDLSRTYVEHAVGQITFVMKEKHEGQVLITGGGAFHQTFVNELKRQSSLDIIIPKKEIVDYKEAIVFAYLGLLRNLGLPNCLSTVTGAIFDVSGGDFFGFNQD